MGFKLLNLCAAAPFLCLLKAGSIRAQCTQPSLASRHVILTAEHLSTQSFPDGSTVTFECVIGHSPVDLEASRSVTCQGNHWTSLELICANGCPAPTIPNAKRSGGKSPSYKLGNFLEYKCEDGYTMKGEAYIVCKENGWDPEPPRCIAPCHSPVLSEHVTLTKEFRSRKSFPHGFIVTVECICGYEPVDTTVSKTITCEETKWTELFLTCKVSEAEPGPSCNMQETGALTVEDIVVAWVQDLVYKYFKKRSKHEYSDKVATNNQEDCL